MSNPYLQRFFNLVLLTICAYFFQPYIISYAKGGANFILYVIIGLAIALLTYTMDITRREEERRNFTLSVLAIFVALKAVEWLL